MDGACSIVGSVAREGSFQGEGVSAEAAVRDNLAEVAWSEQFEILEILVCTIQINQQ